MNRRAPQLAASDAERLEAARRGIILLHDVHPRTAAMMPAFLRYLHENGYRIVHLVAAAPRKPLRRPSNPVTSRHDLVPRRAGSIKLYRERQTNGISAVCDAKLEGNVRTPKQHERARKTALDGFATRSGSMHECSQ